MNDNIYNHIDQEMKYFEICLDMAKRHVEDILLTLSVIDDQHVSRSKLGSINREFLQELNQQIGKLTTELVNWEHLPQVISPENDATGY